MLVNDIPSSGPYLSQVQPGIWSITPPDMASSLRRPMGKAKGKGTVGSAGRIRTYNQWTNSCPGPNAALDGKTLGHSPP